MKCDRLCIIPQTDENQKYKLLVRCKECKWWGSHGATSDNWLPCQVVRTQPNWFCADGELMKEGGMNHELH